MDVEVRGLEQGEPLGLIAPAHGSFADEVAQFVEARIAWDAEQESAASRQRRTPMTQYRRGISRPM